MDWKTKPYYYKDSKSKEWYRVRNLELYRDRLNGVTLPALKKKYNLSMARVQYLIKKERSKHEFYRSNKQR